MMLTTHILTGAVVGKNTGNIWLIAIFSIILHFILDHFRHGEYWNNGSKMNECWKGFLDLFFGFSVLILIIYCSDFSSAKIKDILTAIFFSLVPDVLTVLCLKAKVDFKGILKKIFQFHTWVHRYPPFSKERAWNLRNALNDIIFSLAAIILLII